jgi:hypothetical protein
VRLGRTSAREASANEGAFVRRNFQVVSELEHRLLADVIDFLSRAQEWLSLSGAAARTVGQDRIFDQISTLVDRLDGGASAGVDLGESSSGFRLLLISLKRAAANHKGDE